MINAIDLEYAHRFGAARHGGFGAHVRETRSERGREILAFVASDGAFDVAQVLELFGAYDESGISNEAFEDLRALKPGPLLDLALALVFRGGGDQAKRGLAILVGVAAVHGSAVLDDFSRLVGLLLSAKFVGEDGLSERWQNWSTGSEPVAELSLLRATARAAMWGANEGWLDALNELYGTEVGETLTLKGEGPDVLRRLGPSVRKVGGSSDRPVSVLITPGPGDVELTRECVEAGQWRDAEVLIWDEGPPPEVRGEACITVQAGDWLHPSVIGRLMARLDRRRDLQAVTARRASVTWGGEFVPVGQGASLIEKATQITLMRREALEMVAGDYVGGACGSLLNRLVRKRVGIRIPSATSLPLIISPAENDAVIPFSAACETPQRVRFELDNARIYTVELEPGSRASWVRRATNRAGEENHVNIDIVYATDLRFPGGNTSMTIEEIKAATASGFRVGVLPMSSALVSPFRSSAKRFLDAIEETGATVLDHKNSIDSALTIVRHPTTVQYEDVRVSDIRSRRVLLIANQVPRLRDGGQSIYDPATVVRNASRLFGVQVELVPESAVTRTAIRSVDPNIKMAEFEWPGIVDTSRFRGRSDRLVGRPKVGRHSRDNRLKWPDDVRDIHAAYDIPFADTSILGGVESLKGEVDPRLLDRWDVYPFGSIAVEDFLSSIDIWVYFSSSRQTESFGIAVLEALAAGCTVVLDSALRPVFGDLAYYGSPDVVPGIVMEWLASGKNQRREREDVRSLVESEFGYTAYVERLKASMP